MKRDVIKEIPKVELHCHLDGSVSEEAFKEIAGSAAAGFRNRLRAPVPCGSLKEYLQCFDQVLPFLQEEEAIRTAACDVIRQASLENVIYMEVRFAPGLHCGNGLEETQVCRAVLQGLETGEKLYGVKSRAILCMMRGKPAEYNKRTVAAAKELFGYGVGGIDLAGNEVKYPPELYQPLFCEIEKAGIPLTVHAGECQSAENVRRALEMGARRIGHGVAIADHEEIKALCVKQGICLEMCPTSNLQTKAAGRIEEYPFVRLRKEGVCATIHTDNRTVSGTTLTGEWELLSKAFLEVDENMVRDAAADAAKAAFLPENEKRELVRRIEKRFIKTQKKPD